MKMKFWGSFSSSWEFSGEITLSDVPLACGLSGGLDFNQLLITSQNNQYKFFYFGFEGYTG